MQKNQGVDLTWLGKLKIELSWLNAWPIRCAVGNTSIFARCSWSQMKHDAIKKYTSRQMRLTWWRTRFDSHAEWQRFTFCGHQPSSHWSGLAASWPLVQSQSSIQQKGMNTCVCCRDPDCTVLACATGEKPKWILQVCIDWFHCKEQKYSRDSSWSVISPNQIVTPPSCKEMNGSLGVGWGGEWLESWQTQGKVMWDLIRKPEIFG